MELSIKTFGTFVLKLKLFVVLVIGFA